MATTVVSSKTLAEYKAANSVVALNVFESKTGKKYAKLPSGEFVGMIADDLDSSTPIHVLEMSDTESGQVWLFICNQQEPKEPIGTL